MQNPLQKNSLHIFKLTRPETGYVRTIVTVHGSSGMRPVYAFNGYSDEVIGKAGGCGYDKTHTALEKAVWKLITEQKPEITIPSCDGGCGFGAV